MTKPLITVEHPPRFCPVCFTVLTAISALTGETAPEPGDFTICVGCRSILKVGADYVYEKSSLMEIPTHSRYEFVKALRVIEDNPPPPRRDDVKRS